MILRTVTLLVLVVLISDDGPKHGRRGNSLYKEKKYEAAAEQYRLGLSSLESDVRGRTRFGLLHNLGAALHRAQDFEAARKSFEEAIAEAPSEQDFAKAAYNAGNNAFALQDLEAALEYYQKSLLANPENEEAKFNYEFTKRRLEEQQQQQQQSGDQSGDNQQQDQQNQSGQNPENQNGNQEEQDQQQSDQQSEPEQQNEPTPSQSQQEQPDPEKLSKEEAERILQALQNEEQDLLREMQRIKTPPRRVEKDW